MPDGLGSLVYLDNHLLVALFILRFPNVQDDDSHPSKKRKTPPIESSEPSRPDSETPRVGQIQKKVEEMKMNRISGGPYPVDPINGLTKSPPNDAPNQEQQVDKDKDAADQPPTTPPKDEPVKPENADAEAQDIETDSEEASAPVDTEMAVARRRGNGLKRIVHLDRPIEIDPQEYNRKRKASEKLAGSPFASPAAKRTKEDDASRIKSPTIAEERSDPLLSVKPPSTPQAPVSSSLVSYIRSWPNMYLKRDLEGIFCFRICRISVCIS